MTGNPILCGCSSKESGTACLKLGSNSNKTVAGTQISCTSKNCANVTYTVGYQWVNGPQGLYSTTVTLGSGNYKAQVLQYDNLGEETVSATLIQEDSAASGTFTGENLSVKSNYSVCVTAADDSEYKQRKCNFLKPPRYISSAMGTPAVAMSFLIGAVMGVLYL